MEFTVASGALLKALTIVGGAVPTKSTMAILECILFERADDELRLSATDLEISIVQQLPVQFRGIVGSAPERVAVPARRLLDTLRALPDLPVTFHSDPEQQIELRTDQGRYKMIGFDGADYPALPRLEDVHEVETQTSVLRRAIAKTSFAVSRDALRPAMMGVYFQLNPERGRVVSSDGHRLVKLELDALRAERPLHVIVPEKALALVARVAAPEDAACRLRVGSGYVGFDFERARVLGRLIDEPYPNYEAVIPLDNERRLVVNREALLAAVRRVALYASSVTQQVRLSLEDHRLSISAEDLERASEARETVLCEYDSEPMQIGFNSVYLAEVLSNIDSEDVVMEFSSPNRAGIVMPAEAQEGERMLMLIMPVMLNTYA